MFIQSIIQSSQNTGLDLTLNPVIAITSEQFTPLDVYWFNAYKSSDFPEVTCDKNYFFLYSTDHAVGDGGIYWGKGNNLDLSDFEELGLIITGYQAETPFLYRFPGNARPIHLYYHTAAANPINAPSIQQTNLITTSGGALHTATWTQETNPLGNEAGDEHTGYLKFWSNNAELIGVHYKQGFSYLDTDGQQQYSIISTDGLSATRGDLIDIYEPNLPANRIVQPSFGRFFKKYNQWWWLGCTRRDWLNNSNPPGTLEQIGVNLVLCRANSNFILTDYVALLYENGRYWESYIEGDVMHLYQSVRSLHVSYATFDLTIIDGL